MARKNKRQPRKPQRGLPQPGPITRPSAGTSPASRPSQPAPIAAQRPVRGRAVPPPLPPQDAAIPLDRVPYFRSDLRRIAITAALMFVILIAGSFLIR
jgi:hypothetical protein